MRQSRLKLPISNSTRVYLSQISLLPMLFHVNIRHVAYVRKFVMLLFTNCTTHKYTQH